MKVIQALKCEYHFIHLLQALGVVNPVDWARNKSSICRDAPLRVPSLQEKNI